MCWAYGTLLAKSLSSVLQIGQTDVLIEALEDGEAEDVRWLEWQDGVLSAERPADNAIWRSGEAGRESKLLCVSVKSLAISSHRLWL